MKKALPRITISLSVFNEAEKIRGVLESIFDQDYPIDRMEVIVVDDKSTDRTVEIAKEFPVKIIFSGKNDPEYSDFLAIKMSQGDFFVPVAGDIRLKGKNWFKKMSKPLIENEDIQFVATRYVQNKKESLVSRYLSLDPMQLDPIYKFLVPSLESTITKKRDGYFITKYSQGKIPPQIIGMYRTKILKKLYRKRKTWVDIDFLCLLVERGITKFAYVPTAGVYHLHVDSFIHLLQKRARNLNQSYLPNVEVRKYKWFNLENPLELAKLAFWVVLANVFIPLFLHSVVNAIWHRDPLYLLEAPIAIVLTDFLLINFLIQPSGRNLIKNGFVASFQKISHG